MKTLFLILSLAGLAGLPLAGQSLPRREANPIPPQVETMYTKGLRFLSRAQLNDGSWEGRYSAEPGVVALCTLAFLAHGEDPNHGPYAQNISRSLNYLLANQNENNGYIGNSMYNHGFATLALAESYGVVNDPRLAPALSQAVDLILSAQKVNGLEAWRYTPESHDADTTVTGCQLVALLAARNAGLPVPEEAIDKGLAYLARCRSNQGGIGYTSSSGEKPTLTAVGVTSFSLAKRKDGKGFASSVNYLTNHLNYRDRHYPFYFEYYMSQALFQADSELWEEWNAKNIRYMGASQNPDGSWSDSKGQAYATSCALLSLALNYRFLPIYEK
ncbi:prenyltransferase/squalene oxidase repeat-containing protein [Roseibacillus ishigakijimensis]|uniref:Terpene cyclase/mutase family protein n=1 Tax=Roseibacillus ishigakijimensis TaxID=454146 RepID=A0A934RQH8_9BACT|nr:prenyltransferase/squalene oxidase repeat-containing protein [Roseibacillus ishigakijimensis]MBK1835073.1 terpene cyclase/mutase family protein [Roseibacillus ishigakijimensis]